MVGGYVVGNALNSREVNVATGGRIPNGGIVERDTEMQPQGILRIDIERDDTRPGEGKLVGFFFQRLAGLLHFLVLPFHFDVLLGQQLSLVFQLGIGLLQFFLLALQLAGERLRLFQQVFGARGKKVEDKILNPILQGMQTTIEQLEKARDDLLASMFPKGGKK